MACHTLGEDGQGAATAKLVAGATILNAVPGPASSGYAVFALSLADVPSTVLLRTDFPASIGNAKCTPAPILHLTKRSPRPSTFFRYPRPSTLPNSLTSRMPP